MTKRWIRKVNEQSQKRNVLIFTKSKVKGNLQSPFNFFKYLP
jgi:hypothetical protein